MKENSYILDFIKDVPDDQVISYFQEHHPDIIVRQKGPYMLFKYGIIEARFADPLVREARGIIIDLPKRTIVCRPFVKFSEYDSSYSDVDKIDWGSAHLEYKIDGSLIKLWWDERGNNWHVSTMTRIDASDAPLNAEDLSDNYGNEFWRAFGSFAAAKMDEYPHDRTYLFELLTSQNKSAVVPYTSPYPQLIHLATIDNKTGNEYGPTIEGFSRPRRVPCHSLKQAIDLAEALNKTDDKFSHLTDEGFVVVDENFNRIKIKNTLYLLIHSMIDSGQAEKSKKRIIHMLYNDEISISQLISDGVPCSHKFLYYQYVYEMIKNRTTSFIDVCQTAWKQLNDRKEYALIIQRYQDNIPWSSVAYKVPNNMDKSPEELFKKLVPEKMLLKMVPTYSEFNYTPILRDVFEKVKERDSQNQVDQ